MTYRKKLIEVALPLDAINRESAREKSIRHGHPSTLHLWWARRPLAACRAVIFASLVDDPEQEGVPKELLDAIDALPAPEKAVAEANGSLRRAKLFEFMDQLVRWENTTNEALMEQARKLIRAATGGKPPPLLDPFCGGGSIPLEAQRLGLEAYASDLNPVAVLITKALIEIPPKFAGRPPVNPRASPLPLSIGDGEGKETIWKGAAGLASDVRYYGKWMRDEAWKRIGHLYPKARLTPNPSPLPMERGMTITERTQLSPSTMERGMRSAERLQLCRELRQRQTPAEEFFWELVQDRRFDGLKFRRQHPLGRFIADFYCPEQKLAVEMDGAVHQGQGERDAARDEAIRLYGIRVLRVRNSEILDRTEETLAKLRDTLHTPSPSETERGHGGEATVIAWLWARTVKCPNPACGAQMPLIRSFWLSTKKGKEAWVEPMVDNRTKTVQFHIRGGSGQVGEGTVTRQGATCFFCKAPVSFDQVRSYGQAEGLGIMPLAMVAEGSSGRRYLSFDPSTHTQSTPPDVPWLKHAMISGDTRDFRTALYGMPSFVDLFTPRQLVALTTFSDLVGEARARVLADSGGDEVYANAVATYLAFAVSRLANRGSTVCIWNTGGEKIEQTFARQAIPMTWDFAEGNPFSESTGNWADAAEWVAEAVETTPGKRGDGHTHQLDASAVLLTVESPLIFTDPPYYDNIGYADLADFFYLWLRRSLARIYPGLFSTVLTPKGPEMVASPYRFGGDKNKAKEHFESGLRKAFSLMRAKAPSDYPVTLYYAFKQAEKDANGNGGSSGSSNSVVSTGWQTMLQGLLDAGLRVTGTWPLRTERATGLKAAVNALASSIVIACRPRPEDAPIATRREFLAALRRELPPALKTLMNGHVAPVDLAQAAIGPGMAVFSRYSRVLEADGSPMWVRTALQEINYVVDDYLAQQEGDLDVESQFCAAWFASYGPKEGPFGEADVLARAKNVSVDTLARLGLLDSARGKVRLTLRAGYEEGWDPNTQPKMTAWEACQRLVWTLGHSGGGETPAGRVARRLGGLAGRARVLAFRLYTIAERKGWADEALGYNALVASWPEIERKAAESAQESQGRMA